MDEIKAKQQVVEKIKESAKILVTVSDSPSVDALSAALALTMILDKQEKYATAIFSGETPPAIAFLEPEKTFDDTTDSLRDFIIALNKEKADHLRYKVEGESVKIFITPYKTTIDQSDLEFSQGDYNVELVIALGVDSQEHLDKALEGHGQILHDAAIVTLTAGEQSSDLGGIDWHDANASSLSEMIAGLAEALKEDKKKSLLDQSIATALLTGIVAETDRFSNEHTTSKAMTVAATLMSAGADQQLIANELQASHTIETPEEVIEEETPEEDSDVEIDKDSADGSLTIKNHDPSSLDISHDGESLAELDRRVLGDKKAKEKVTEEVETLQEEAAREEAAEEALEVAEEAADAPRQERFPEPKVAPIEQPVSEPSAYEAPQVVEAYQEEPAPLIGPATIEGQGAISEPTPPAAPAVGTAYAQEEEVEPTLGGTLNATTEQAAEDSRREEESSKNHTILSHAYLGGDDNAAGAPTGGLEGFPGTPAAAPGSQGVNDFSNTMAEAVHSAYAVEDEAPAYEEMPTVGSSLGSGRVIQPLEPSVDTANTFAAANTAYAPEPTLPPIESAPQPAVPGANDFGLPLPPPIPDFSQVNGAVPGTALPPAPAVQPAILGDILAPEPAATENAYAPVPVEPLPPAPTQPVPGDPTQFQIPNQQ